MSEHNSVTTTSSRRQGDKPQARRYSVEVVATLSGVGAATIRRYERYGLVEPTRAAGGPSWYSDRDVERVKQIRRLSDDLGVNLAAVEVILNMRERMLAMHDELVSLRRRKEVD
jgi:MerR family transcriptional regulator/heat shock protein HspR